MNKFKFDVSFRVKHPSVDPDQLSTKLGLLAHRKWRAGDQRKTPKGELLGGIYKESYLSCRITHEKSDDLAKVIRETTLRLSTHKELLRELSMTGGKLEYFIGWYSSGNSGEEFDALLLKEAAELGIGLSFDFYGGQ